MKRSKKIVAIAMLLAMIVMMAGTREAQVLGATDGRTYQAKYDTMFEDFDREDVSNTVKASGNVVDSGKAYLKATYGADTANPDDAIYKQAIPGDSGRGNLVIIMKSEDGSATLEDIILGTRYNDSFPVYAKSLAELNDANLDSLPELTTEYQKYVINFANSYEDNEVYEGSDVQVNSGVMVGFHLYSTDGAEGTIEISQMYFTTDDSDVTEATRTILNNFTGGETVDVTANASTATWWCGSATGVIVKRAFTLNAGGTLEIINSVAKAGDYGFAVITAEGDLANLNVSTHTGEFATAQPYNSSIVVDGDVDGFKLVVSDGSVIIRNIFFTNFEEDVVASGVPKINATTVQLFDNFEVAQDKITADYDEMAARPEMAASNLYYRLSYNNGDKVKLQDGKLTFDATALAEGDYINFKTACMTPNTEYPYLVLKVKAEDGASFEGFRFSTMDGSAIVWGNGGLKSGSGLLIGDLADETYSYTTSDGWKYIVVDLVESGLATPENSLEVLDMYYSGTGNLSIDEIFWAKPYVPSIEDATLTSTEAVTYTPAGEGYAYLGYVSAMNDNAAPLLLLQMKGAKGASLDSVRLEFKNKEDVTTGVFWFLENAEGTLRGINGNLLPALSEESQTYVIDLAKSGISTDIGAFHVHSGGDSVGGEISLEAVGYAAIPEYDTIMEALPVFAAPDTTAPEITLDVPENAMVGDVISIIPVVNDDTANVVIQIAFNGKEIATSDTITVEEGVYTITVTATDDAENESQVVKQITVKADQNKATEVFNDTNTENKGVKVAIIVILVIVIIALVTGTLLYKKKKDSNKKENN